MDITTLLLIILWTIILPSFLLYYIFKRRMNIQKEFHRTQNIIKKYENELYSAGYNFRSTEGGNGDRWDNYRRQKNNYNGYTESESNSQINFCKFHIYLNKKNIKYIEDNFSDIPYFRSINRERLINTILVN
tara:strand:- start:70892 stop:71287 length:396 start_codon:yes stop_codon:yes gene_type:complete